MANPLADLKSIFGKALELPTSQERSAYLDQACHGDASLRAEVESLLRVHPNAGGFFGEQPPATLATVDLPRVDLPGVDPVGAQIGPYKIREILGEGGMGRVYAAEQEKPLRRKVALKIIRPGMDSRQVIARFDAERQALALMDHSHIAKVLDAGTTDDGRPYFVMELVRGVPITEFCDTRNLTTRQRLELFIQVCQAVQHAHQKGIIHRDIKPSNVLVTLHDDKAVPKVIDFGVAKATSSLLTEHSIYTGVAQLIGTPLYMSPEQAEMNALDVDTRSDVYSLGVLLYELITGVTPFDRETFQRAGFDEMRRLIREIDPPRPSERVSTFAAEARTTVSQRRGVKEEALPRTLRGELDWIVMKALEKDRTRRYESASAFAADVQRYLSDESVQACPPSWRYRMRKLVVRHRGPVIAATALSALLVFGIIGTSMGLVWAVKAERRATSAASAESHQRQAAETQRDRALTAEAQAKAEAAIAKAVNDFLNDDLLGQADPENNSRDKNVTAEQLLDRAAENIADKFVQQPRVEAAIRLSIGNAYRNLGNLSAAQTHLERAVALRRAERGDEHRETLQAENDLAGVYLDQGKYSQARTLLESVLETRRRVLGDEHSDTLTTMHDLATAHFYQGDHARAEHLETRLLEIHRRRSGDHDPATLKALNSLAVTYRGLNQFAKAAPLSRQVLEGTERIYGAENPRTLIALNNLALTLLKQGEIGEAERLLARAVETGRRVLGPEHPKVLAWMSNLAWVYMEQKEFAKAEAYGKDVLALQRKVLGDDHPHTIVCMGNVGSALSAQVKYPEAEQLYRRLIAIQGRVKGQEHRDTLKSMENLATALIAQFSREDPGKRDEAIAVSAEALEIRRRVYGDENAETLKAIDELAVLYVLKGEATRAESLFRISIEVRRRMQGVDQNEPIANLESLASELERRGNLAVAEALRNQVLTMAGSIHGTQSQPMAEALCRLGANLVAQQKYAAAEPLLLQCHELANASNLRLRRQVFECLGRLYEGWGKADEAARWKSERQPHEEPSPDAERPTLPRAEG